MNLFREEGEALKNVETLKYRRNYVIYKVIIVYLILKL